MRAIFLADAHLAAPADNNYVRLLDFLHDLEGNVDELFIMGDLFDFWIGFPSNPFVQYEAVLAALELLVAGGCRLTYFEGNHDFHLGEAIAHRLKAEIHTGPIIRDIQGMRLYLCHGDQLNPADRGYRLLRLLLHNRLAAQAVKVIPPAFAFKIRDKLQHSSRRSYHSKTARWDYRTIILSAARTAGLRGCSGLVTGHFHLAFCEQLDCGETAPAFTVLSLGDWITQFTYGEMRDGTLRLATY
ncbi:MAG TPA: UDP-2,3-diacylglucosamine diphosphatase [Desulfuromonadales bacterium]|nr:UDP-2,3-diacylglucosamine diphosphatase [Desulfuromonadales bacterium]